MTRQKSTKMQDLAHTEIRSSQSSIMDYPWQTLRIWPFPCFESIIHSCGKSYYLICAKCLKRS